jgi:glycosyltransferase involved in cell wall biosynthesis
MRVAFFVHCFFPKHFYGTETYTYNLARHLKRTGHDPVVVSAIFPGEPSAGELISRYTFDDIPVVSIDKNFLPNTRVKDTYYHLEMRPVFEKLLRELRPDLVHVTHLINHTAVLLEVTKALAIPTFATLTDFFGFCFNNKLEAADGKLCAGPNSRRTNCLACYLKDAASASSAEPWIRWAGAPPRVKWVAPLVSRACSLPSLRSGPVDGLVQDLRSRPDILLRAYSNYRAVITPTRFLQTAYQRNGLKVPAHNIWFGVDVSRAPKPHRSGGTPLFGFIGQIARHKGTDILIDALRRLGKGCARLRIYGPSDQDPIYMDKLRSAAEGFAVEFAGTFPKEQMARIMSEIDVLVIPSRWYENSPLVLLNALATHTPVIVSNVAGMTEFIKEGENGFSFDRGSSKSLAKIMQRFVSEPGLAAEMANNTFFERTTEIMATDTIKLYLHV